MATWQTVLSLITSCAIFNALSVLAAFVCGLVRWQNSVVTSFACAIKFEKNQVIIGVFATFFAKIDVFYTYFAFAAWFVKIN